MGNSFAGVPVEIVTGLGGALIGAAATYLATAKAAKNDLRIAREKLEADLRIAREKLEAENRPQNAATTTIRSLLNEPGWELRTFDTIRKRVRGFKDDDLRKMIVACGAVAFEEEGSGQELWGLPDRNAARLRPTGDLPALKVTLAAPAAGDVPRGLPSAGLVPKAP